MCVHVFVCVCARACARVCMFVCVFVHVFVRVCVSNEVEAHVQLKLLCLCEMRGY